MEVLVPFAASGAKTRLSPALSAAERDSFARAMLADVLSALTETADAEPTVLATGEVDCDAPVAQDDRGLDAAINERLADRNADEPLAVVMADLALATADALDRLLTAEAAVVLAPGRGGGTNALLTRHPEFRVDYHGASIDDHRAAAGAIDATLTEIDSFRLATDVDEPADLAEVLLHTEGAAKDWLVDAGFELVVDGRVTVERR